MKYLWTCAIRITPWTGTYDCRSWRVTELGLRVSASSMPIGTYCRWWIVREYFTGNHLKVGGGGVTQGYPLSPTIFNLIVD